MLFKMSESNTSETCVKTEVGQTFRWETREMVNEGDQLLAKGQVMGSIATKLDIANNSVQITYYGISIPSEANVNGSEGKIFVICAISVMWDSYVSCFDSEVDNVI